MDQNAIALFAIMGALVVACIVIFLSFYGAMRRAGAESRRRLIARSAFMNWAAMAVVAPVLALSALGVLPRWLCAAVIVVACIVSVLSARYARRSTMRSHGLT
jgi:Kef-type K+ transport system membrane component KefB